MQQAYGGKRPARCGTLPAKKSGTLACHCPVVAHVSEDSALIGDRYLKGRQLARQGQGVESASSPLHDSRTAVHETLQLAPRLATVETMM